jgi:hypothetical protein
LEAQYILIFAFFLLFFYLLFWPNMHHTRICMSFAQLRSIMWISGIKEPFVLLLLTYLPTLRAVTNECALSHDSTERQSVQCTVYS